LLKEDTPVTSDRNKALAHRYWDEVINKGKVAVLDEIIAADYLQHHVGLPPGLAGLRKFVEASIAAFPDQHSTVDDILADGDRVITRTTIRATHTGPFRGIAPTGRPIAVEVIDIWRVEGGKLKEHWGVFDNLAFMRQLGAIPEEPLAAPPTPRH
jgi:predicted ester cyclase